MLVALVAGSVVFAAAYAAAASVSVSSDGLAAGDAPVSKCDEFGFSTVSFMADPNNLITQVTIGDIAPACIGGTMTVNLVSSGGASVGAGSALVVDTPSEIETVVVDISPTPPTTAVKHVKMLVIGP